MKYIERERSRRRKESQGPVRMQAWFNKAWKGTWPVRIIDGVADDLHITWKRETTRIDRIVFTHMGKIYVHRFPEVLVLRTGDTWHLALNHLRLHDKFGINVLG